jgi:hypothetical protein
MPQSGSGGYAIYSSPYYGHGNLFLPSTKLFN